MRILVVDTEVTGLDPELDRPVEIATVEVLKRRGTWSVGEGWSALVNPEGRPISFGAMGTHHITEKMVRRAKPLDAVVPARSPLREASVPRAAHVASFDRNHVERVFPETEWICTYKCARRAWPGMESYRNMSLRYALGIEVRGTGAHRALLDATVTAHVLVRLLGEVSYEELVKISGEPILLETCNFQKHKGKTWEEVAEVDPGYLAWVVGKGPTRTLPNGEKTGFDEDTLHTARHWLELRRR